MQYDSFDVNKLVSQNFRQNIVRVKFCNFHTVCVSFRIASRRKLCQHGPLDFLSPTQIMITHQKMWYRVWAKNDIKKDDREVRPLCSTIFLT